MLAHDPHQSWQTNMTELHGLHESQVAAHQERRDAVASMRDHPGKEQRLAHMDAEMEQLQKHANASGRGKIFFDAKEVSGADPIRQRWISEARKRGQIERPSDSEPSQHDLDKHNPIRVERGDPRSSALMTR